jgi:hypothetical protein
MAKKFMAIKTSFVLAMLIMSMFAALSFSASARIFKIEPILNFEYDTPTENVIPMGDVLTINISTSFSLSGVGANFVQKRSLLKNSEIIIKLNVSTDNDWVYANIIDPLATLRVSQAGETWESTLQISVSEEAPAFTLDKVTVTATSSNLAGFLFNIEEKTEIFEVPFEIGYWGVVSYNACDGNYFEVTPYNITRIPINIKNLGNGATVVNLEVVESPENWNISIPSSIILQPFEEEEQQVFLEVLTDHTFDEETIQIKTTSHYLGSPNLQGTSEILTFDIINDGSYKEPSDGFEINIVILAIILVLLIIFIMVVVIFIKRK